MKKETKKITLEEIALLIKSGNESLSKSLTKDLSENLTKTLSKKFDEKIDGLAIIIANSFEGMEDRLTKNMVTKKDLALTEFHLQTQISGLETDLKSFKEEVRN